MPDYLTDHDEVAALMQQYIAGADGDGARLRAAFAPTARMVGRFGDHAVDVPIEEWIGQVEANPGASGPDYAARIRSVDLTGDAGVVVLVETDYLGCDFVDYFSVARVDGVWRIVQKTFAHTGGTPPG